MTLKQENKNLKRHNKKMVEACSEGMKQLDLAAKDLEHAAELITYMSGQIDAYRDCLNIQR